MDKIRQ